MSTTTSEYSGLKLPPAFPSSSAATDCTIWLRISQVVADPCLLFS